jgi:hypothetical protein
MEKKIVAVSFPEIKLAHAKAQVPEAVIVVFNLLLAEKYEYEWGVSIDETEFLDRLVKFLHSSESFGVDIDTVLVEHTKSEDFTTNYLDSIFKHLKYIYETEGAWKKIDIKYDWRIGAAPNRKIQFCNV